MHPLKTTRMAVFSEIILNQPQTHFHFLEFSPAKLAKLQYVYPEPEGWTNQYREIPKAEIFEIYINFDKTLSHRQFIRVKSARYQTSAIVLHMCVIFNKQKLKVLCLLRGHFSCGCLGVIDCD